MKGYCLYRREPIEGGTDEEVLLATYSDRGQALRDLRQCRQHYWGTSLTFYLEELDFDNVLKLDDPITTVWTVEVLPASLFAGWTLRLTAKSDIAAASSESPRYIGLRTVPDRPGFTAEAWQDWRLTWPALQERCPAVDWAKAAALVERELESHWNSEPEAPVGPREVVLSLPLLPARPPTPATPPTPPGCGAKPDRRFLMIFSDVALQSAAAAIAAEGTTTLAGGTTRLVSLTARAEFVASIAGQGQTGVVLKSKREAVPCGQAISLSELLEILACALC